MSVSLAIVWRLLFGWIAWHPFPFSPDVPIPPVAVAAVATDTAAPTDGVPSIEIMRRSSSPFPHWMNQMMMMQKWE